MDGHPPTAAEKLWAEARKYAAKDGHERDQQADQDEQAQAFDVLGDHLTSTAFAVWLRDRDGHSDERGEG
jgi:hypothetical protein